MKKITIRTDTIAGIKLAESYQRKGWKIFAAVFSASLSPSKMKIELQYALDLIESADVVKLLHGDGYIIPHITTDEIRVIMTMKS